jgi:hypothetical protein
MNILISLRVVVVGGGNFSFTGQSSLISRGKLRGSRGLKLFPRGVYLLVLKKFALYSLDAKIITGIKISS